MPDKQVLEFIVSQKRIGAHIEKIRSDLRTNDWTDADVDAAIAYLELRDKKRVVRAKAFKKALVIVLVIILILGGTYVTLVAMGRKVPLMPQAKPETIKFPDFVEKVVEEEKVVVEPVIIIDDITQVRAVFEKEFPDMKYVRAEKENESIIVSAIASTTVKNLVFTKVADIWAYSGEKVEEVVIDAARPKVTDIKVRPLPPQVNNKDTNIQITITNIGTIPTAGNISFIVQYDDNATTTAVYKKVIAPDETAIWTYVPYPVGKKYTDTPGKHKITITLPNEDPFSLEFDLY